MLEVLIVVAILILIFVLIDTALLVRLNKCGKVVIVKNEHTYVPQPKVKKVTRKVEVSDDED